MKNNFSHLGCAALVLGTLAFAAIQSATAQSATNVPVSLQGVLKEDDICGTGWYHIIWRVVPGPVDPDNPWPTNCPNCFDQFKTNSIYVNNGLFTTTLDIPQHTLENTTEAYLQIGVRTNGTGAFTPLLPMQRLTSTPFAAVAQSVIGPIPASSLTGAMPTGMLTGIFSSPLSLSNPGNVFAGDGSLLTHVNATTIGGLDPCNLHCYWKLAGNDDATSVSFVGTRNDQPLTLKAHNQIVMRYVPRPGLPNGANLIGGDVVNKISGGGGSVICGGGGVGVEFPYADLGNEVANDHSAIVGGLANTIFGRESFIGGGWGNMDDGANTSHCTVIGGGSNNYVNVDFTFIGGGVNNSARGISSLVAGGQNNLAIGMAATIPGGSSNSAYGSTSFAAGNRAKALHDGTYVWGDGQNADFASSGTNQYLIRAAGGVGIGTSSPVMQLHVQGDTRITGVTRSGSETGTSQLPSPAGLVVRRINSTSAALNQIVARNDRVTLERDGSNGGMIIRYPAGTYRQAITCTALTSAGTQINYYSTLVNPAAASTLPIFNGATNVVQFHCTFGDSYNSGHSTEVNMIREGTDYFWVGTLTSTYNQ